MSPVATCSQTSAACRAALSSFSTADTRQPRPASTRATDPSAAPMSRTRLPGRTDRIARECEVFRSSRSTLYEYGVLATPASR